MRTFLALGTLAIFAALSVPASAQMCGGGQAQADTTASSSMCGGMMNAQATAPATGEQQAEAKPSGCACCQNMAMMQPPKEGNEAMPGMEMPSQEAPEAKP
ncbi:MAG TPA: hypothetical protein VGN97_13435 [Mesorhizobium sp.]|jgi:hypothetical protein|nr:hypothetical protein [Mesorhizobium sp.]